MKRFHAFFLATAVAVLLSSCDSNESVEVDPFPVGSTFDLQSFSTVRGSKSPVGGANIRITFRNDSTIRGRTFTSERGHNTFFGTYEWGVDGSFAAEPGGMTQVNEPEGSRIGDFLQGLRYGSRYVCQGDQLLIFYDAGILVLTEFSTPASGKTG